ncbi:beta-ketoacyl synthase N-terminal-like domain-containing protein [Dactylosporangium sucinum]|uniref:3-oxoacyl-ACP synthase n=1 Tax=Dactylosporangium sucinum TaxID=1424081 RepID=A0A917T0K3_9ACTN|nr:beta-ketoacyl synthase N-terminal-like domain-containing protein [Dactylosporangium sucinum]GGM04968.1 3-oxoacyl-ACP synthase [Dactylosporangium sucinum]
MTTTTDRPAVRPLAVTAEGVVTPAGIGLDTLVDALGGRAAACADPAKLPGQEVLPEPVRLVEDLRLAEHVGRKGTRYLDRTTALGLVSSHLALRGSGPGDPAATGVVVGTSSGSLRSIGEFARDTLVRDEPYLVDAATFPNTVMNCCAGQIAIWNGLQGVNATVAGGQLSSFHAVRYGRNAINAGRVGRVLLGGVEELCPQTAWGWRATRLLDPQMPIGEGCALFVVEDAEAAAAAGRTVAAELLACEVESPGPVDARPPMAHRLARTVTRALARSGVRPEEVSLVAPGATGLAGLDAAEQRAIRRTLGPGTAQLRVKDVVGECFSANGALQLAAVLAHWRAPDAGGPVALLTALGPDGSAGCLVVRRAAS